ncbi:MAG: hypothetical protein ACRELU_11360, partial [Gemmatimonadota bacterium]
MSDSQTLAMTLAPLLGALAGCTDPSPTAVAPDSRSLTAAAIAQIPEEELLGGLFSGASPLTAGQAQGWSVTLSHQAGRAASSRPGRPTAAAPVARPWQSWPAARFPGRS